MDEAKKLYIYATGKGYHYFFTCRNCESKYELITGNGRYGNLGPFTCPTCNKEYYATIDDHQFPSLYVAVAGEQPTSLLDGEGRNRSIKIEYNGLGMY